MKQARIEEIYDQLGTLVVELARDPVAMGPAYLQDLISKTRGMLNTTSLMVHEVHRQKSAIETELDAAEAAYSISSDSLLADDARVTRLPNIEDRRAMINLILREERAKIVKLKNQVKELGFVDKAVRHRHKELENTVSAIRMQKGLIDAELRTGSFYGDETETSRKSQYRTPQGGTHSTMPNGFTIDDDELTNLLEVTSAAVNEQATTDEEEDVQPVLETATPKPQPVVVSADPEPNSDEAAIAKFLEGEDYSSLFDNL